VCQKLFPAYEFRDLPANSPIYTNEQFSRKKWSASPHVEALSNGARELVLLVSSRDPSRYWQTRTYGGHEETHQLFDDIFLYTVARGGKRGYGLTTKGDTYVVTPDSKVAAANKIKVARLQFAGNWDPEPGSWRRLSAILHNDDATDLDVRTIKLGEGQLDQSFQLAHLTGTFKFSLPQGQRDEIKKYVEAGGTLVVEACGGDGDFSASVDKEMAAIFPDAAKAAKVLAPDSPAFALGPKLDAVGYRAWAKKIIGNLHTPRIKGLEINHRLAVFVSSEDLSCGMVGMPIDGIYGYEPDSATALMTKLVLFSAGAPPAAH
jgi:hypothetical protein